MPPSPPYATIHSSASISNLSFQTQPQHQQFQSQSQHQPENRTQHLQHQQRQHPQQQQQQQQNRSRQSQQYLPASPFDPQYLPRHQQLQQADPVAGNRANSPFRPAVTGPRAEQGVASSAPNFTVPNYQAPRSTKGLPAQYYHYNDKGRSGSRTRAGGANGQPYDGGGRPESRTERHAHAHAHASGGDGSKLLSSAYSQGNASVTGLGIGIETADGLAIIGSQGPGRYDLAHNNHLPQGQRQPERQQQQQKRLADSQTIIGSHYRNGGTISTSAADAISNSTATTSMTPTPAPASPPPSAAISTSTFATTTTAVSTSTYTTTSASTSTSTLTLTPELRTNQLSDRRPAIQPRTSSLLPPPYRGDFTRDYTLTTAKPSPQSRVGVGANHTSPDLSLSPKSKPNTGTDSNSDSKPQPRPNLSVDVYTNIHHASNSSSTFDSLTASSQATSNDNSGVLSPASEGLRNLHRWSASTASTALSPPIEQKQKFFHHQSTSSSPSRRVSIDSIALFERQQAEQPSTSFAQASQSPPSRNLTKRRLSSGSILGTASPPRARASGQPPPRPSSPPLSARPPPRVRLPSLPPIVSHPPLDVNQGPQPTDSAHPAQRPSPALGTPESVFSNHRRTELNNPSDSLAAASNTSSPAATRGNSPALLPAAPVVRDTMRGHTRNRSSTGNGGSEPPKPEKRSKPSQKAMLSKALSKANMAVHLDNAQEYERARESYIEACDLLCQVLARTTGEEDRKKLEAIRRTYTTRIEELDGMLPGRSQRVKELPPRPESLDYGGTPAYSSSIDEQDEPAVFGTATTAIIGREQSPKSIGASTPVSPARRRPTLDASRLGTPPRAGAPRSSLQSSLSPVRRNFEGGNLSVSRTEDAPFLPAPLSPRRPISPARPPSPDPIVRRDFSLPSDRLGADSRASKHSRIPSHESVSWLDPIDESGGSAASSVHSRSSSLGITRRHTRAVSRSTEAEFDAALDAAVEAAYDDGYELMDPTDMAYDDDDDYKADRARNTTQKGDLVNERVQQTEREAAINLARERERQRQLSTSGDSQTFGVEYDGNDSEEDERILDEFTEYAVSDYSFGQQSQQISNGTRASDSSGLTSRTWHSSIGSNPPTATTLSTVTEIPSPAPISKNAPPSLPPSQALPQIPQAQPASGVRTRRLSGRNLAQLKIETSQIGQTPSTAPDVAAPASPQTGPQKTGGYIVQQRQALSATSARPGAFSVRASSPSARDGRAAEADEVRPPPSRRSRSRGTIQEEDEGPRTESPSLFRPKLHSNFSSSSLRSLRQRQLSISNLDDAESPLTPLSQQPTNTSISRQPLMPAVPSTPLASSFRDRSVPGFGGLHLFESDFHVPAPHSPGSLHERPSDAPLPLEPCPADVMLRPFWLMRALYQTLAHPRGGYLTHRLFVPRDAWKVKGVKLRALEDKTSQCDLLTAALLKLARVDSTDADAVLDEMQSFENILEQVQATLTRRLGNDVGTHGMANDKDGESATPVVPRSASVSSKSAFSWRRLRSKGSAANLTSAYGSKSSSGGGGAGSSEKEVVTVTGSGTIPSLPMVAHPSSRPAKRDVASVKFDGPNAGYMASLARLFDAAQTVARQVEDPGLRHADKTQVGLELCTRHAAEFFGFYICRFVLQDLGLLLDKFVKRGSEWVLN
ncbi:hypothetical protein DL764_000414 [Monosporascus ibericus]|uniref:MIT domain-containing protein n=1 Tax=Monosporascus ibericus TaxID=155417 RepID=A0A4Q4TV90_9PEZI|nr:hypothetical protein DL764_000414 [Monosporascus ibericus]